MPGDVTPPVSFFVDSHPVGGEPMSRNYYIILGIPIDASQPEIKSAYRKRAKELHPDHYGENTAPFRELQEAYSILSNPEDKKAYDRRVSRSRDESAPSPHVEPFNPIDSEPAFGDISLTHSFDTYSPSFDEIFDRLWNNFKGHIRSKSEAPKSLNVEIILTPEEVLHGGSIRLMVPVELTCPICRGHGIVEPFLCVRCGGARKLTGEHPVQVRYPAGIVDNHLVQISLENLGIKNIFLTVLFRPGSR
jgi:DnaJ-class molecular chaperone